MPDPTIRNLLCHNERHFCLSAGLIAEHARAKRFSNRTTIETFAHAETEERDAYTVRAQALRQRDSLLRQSLPASPYFLPVVSRPSNPSNTTYGVPRFSGWYSKRARSKCCVR